MNNLSQMRWMLKLLGIFRIPMIGFVGPKLVSLDDEKVVVSINLTRRSKNHLGAMYFGALAVGADIAGGIHAFYFAKQSGKKISFSFKGMNASFIKRAESRVTFECEDGLKVEAALRSAVESGDRINDTVRVIAYNTSREIVAEFEMCISVKCY